MNAFLQLIKIYYIHEGYREFSLNRLYIKRQLSILFLLASLLILFPIKDVLAAPLVVYINNKFVPAGKSIKIFPNSKVVFEIHQLSPNSITLDPRGDGRGEIVLGSSTTVFYETIYSWGTYQPTITARTATGNQVDKYTFTLTADHEQKTVSNTEVVKILAWPLTILLLLLCTHMFYGKEIRTILQRFRVQTLKIAGAEVTTQNIESEVDEEIERVVLSLEQKYPAETSARIIPPIEEIVTYDVNVIYFLNSICVKIKNSTVWSVVGNYFFNKDPEKAREAYDNAISIDQNNPVPLTNRGFLYLNVFNNRWLAYSDFRKAIQLATKRNLRAPWAYVGTALIHKRNGQEEDFKKNMERAKELFHELVQINRNDPWAYYGLGYCYYRLGNLQAAIEANKMALNIDSMFTSAHYNQACYMVLQGNREEGVESLRQMVSWVTPLLRTYKIQEDPDFVGVKDYEPFRSFMDTFKLKYTPGPILSYPDENKS